MIAPATYLLDGPLSELPLSRDGMTGLMATALLPQQAYAVRGDAIAVLRRLGYSTIDVFLLVDEAIYLAQQQVVAREMSES